MAKWEIFEKEHRTMAAILGDNWQPIPQAKKMRNDLVHGNKVFDLADCKVKAEEVVLVLKKLHNFIQADYGVDPWQKQPEREAVLQWHMHSRR